MRSFKFDFSVMCSKESDAQSICILCCEISLVTQLPSSLWIKTPRKFIFILSYLILSNQETPRPGVHCEVT